MTAKTAAVKTAREKTTIKLMNKSCVKRYKNEAERIPAPTKKALSLTKMSSFTDVYGSYTGRCEKGEKPMQDADDL